MKLNIMLKKYKPEFILIGFYFLVLALSYSFHLDIKHICAGILIPAFLCYIGFNFRENIFLLIIIGFSVHITMLDFWVSSLSVLTSLWILLMILLAKNAYKINSRLKMFLIFFIISMSLSFIFAKNKVATLKWIIIIFPYFITFLLLSKSFERKYIRKIFNFLLIPLSLNILLSLKQLISLGTDYRFDGFIGNPNTFGGYLAFNIFMLIYLITITSSKFLKAIYITFLSFSTIFLLLTQSRGAQLGLLASLLLFIILKTNSKKKFKTITIMLIVIGVLGAAGSATAFSRFSSLSLNNLGYSELDRLSLWYSAIKIFSDHPIFGIGINNFHDQYNDYHILNKILGATNVDIHFHGHNIIFNCLASLGIVGLCAYVYFAYIIYLYIKRRNTIILKLEDKELESFILCFLLYYIVHGQFDVIFTVVGRHQLHLLLMLWLSSLNHILNAQDKLFNEKMLFKQ
jgi:O-antigen ligase